MDDDSIRNEKTLRTILKAWPLPLVRDVNPYESLGVFRSTIAEPIPVGSHRPPYIERSVDGEIRTALHSRRLVVVGGPSKAGKSRTAFEALQATLPDRRIIIPIAPVTRSDAGAAGAPLVAISEHAMFGSGLQLVLWLDDAENHLRPGHLTLETLNKLNDSLPGLVVVATLRDHRLASLKAIEGLSAVIDDLLTDPGSAYIHLSPVLNEEEFKKASTRYPAYSDRPNLRHLGEFFVAADELLYKYKTRWELDPVGAAIIRAALDWQRAGMAHDISQAELYELTAPYFAEVDIGTDLTEITFKEGLAWARKPVSSSAAMLLPVMSHGLHCFRVFDYLLEWASSARSPESVSVIPSQLITNEEEIPHYGWEFVEAHAHEGDWLSIAIAAHLAGRATIEGNAWSRAVSVAGSSGALASLLHGDFLQMQDDPESAIAEYEKVLKAGHAEYVDSAAFQSGLVHQSRGELEVAKQMYERAAAGGSQFRVVAELYLAQVLGALGDLPGSNEHKDRAMSEGDWSVLEADVASDLDELTIRNELVRGTLFALGSPAGDISEFPTSGTESDLLHFTIDDEDGTERVMMPVFTRIEFLRSAVLRNPMWQWLSVLVIDGGALVPNLDADATMVLNPWSPLEYQLRPAP